MATAPRPNPVIVPANVHLDVAKSKTLFGKDGLKLSRTPDPKEPDTFVYSFDFPPSDAVTVIADIQVGLHAKSDRDFCDLQMMQFVTPREMEVVYVGIKGGNTRVTFAGNLLDRLFLDGHSQHGSLTHNNAPFMTLPGAPSTAAQFAPNTRDGHFKNMSVDSPGGRNPSYVVVSSTEPTFNGEKHFLWRITRRDEYMTFAVFIHPSGERQPLALVRWTCRHSYRVQWRQSKGGQQTASVRSGFSSITLDGDVTTKPAELTPHVEKIKSPPDWIHLHANPQQIALFAALGAKAVERTSTPLDHPDVEADFFVVDT